MKYGEFTVCSVFGFKICSDKIKIESFCCMKDYIFLKTEVDDWNISNTEISGQTRHSLQFHRDIERKDGRTNVIISLDFRLEEVVSNFRLNAKTRSLFRVLDSKNIIVDDVHDMYCKAVGDLSVFLEYKLGRENVTIKVVETPSKSEVLGDLLELVTQLHSES